MKVPRRLALSALVCALMTGRPAWAAPSFDPTSGVWVAEPRAFVGGVVPVGDAARIYGGALGLGIGAAFGRPESRLRWRTSLEAQLATDVGAGASLSVYRAALGAAFAWRGHLLTALDLGPSLRRLALGGEISRSQLGGALVAELGWRFRPEARWSVTLGVRGSVALYPGDAFQWSDLGACLTLERLAHP